MDKGVVPMGQVNNHYKGTWFWGRFLFFLVFKKLLKKNTNTTCKENFTKMMKKCFGDRCIFFFFFLLFALQETKEATVGLKTYVPPVILTLSK